MSFSITNTMCIMSHSAQVLVTEEEISVLQGNHFWSDFFFSAMSEPPMRRRSWRKWIEVKSNEMIMVRAAGMIHKVDANGNGIISSWMTRKIRPRTPRGSALRPSSV